MKAVASVIGAVALAATATAASAAQTVVYAGSYTAGSSKGIYAWRFDETSGAMTPLGLAAETPQAAHLWGTPDGKYLYTVNWENDGGVSGFAVNRADGRLTFLNRVSSRGALPNQVMLDPRGQIAVTVNYTTGNLAAYKVGADGKLSDAFYVDQHIGKPLSEKQPGPKAHGIQFSPDGRFMYVAELGLDRVYAYKVDARTATITPGETPYVSVHAGAGPRRMQISADGKRLYVNHETDSEVSVFEVNGTQLKEIQTVSTLPPDYAGRNSTAEIVLDSSAKHLYVSNRGSDTIALFDVGADGRLALKLNTPAGGRTPRNLRFDPDRNFLLSANENGGSITVFRIDKSSGALTLVGPPQPINTPGGMYFVRLP